MANENKTASEVDAAEAGSAALSGFSFSLPKIPTLDEMLETARQGLIESDPQKADLIASIQSNEALMTELNNFASTSEGAAAIGTAAGQIANGNIGTAAASLPTELALKLTNTALAGNSETAEISNSIAYIMQDEALVTDLENLRLSDPESYSAAISGLAAGDLTAAAAHIPANISLQLTNYAIGEGNPEVAGIINTIQGDEALVGALENLRTQNPEMLKSVMGQFTGAENGVDVPEGAMKAAQEMLGNDVLRGQVAEMINNVAENPNITDAHIKDLMEASEKFQAVAKDSMGSLKGAFGAFSGSDTDFAEARKELAQAYSNLGMDEADFNAVLEQGAIIGINGMIDSADNFGSGISTGLNSIVNDAGAVFRLVGLGGIADTLGISDRGLGDLLVHFNIASEEQIASFMEIITSFLQEYLDFDILDGMDFLNIGSNGLTETVAGWIGVEELPVSEVAEAKPAEEPVVQEAQPEDVTPEEYQGASLDTSGATELAGGDADLARDVAGLDVKGLPDLSIIPAAGVTYNPVVHSL